MLTSKKSILSYLVTLALYFNTIQSVLADELSEEDERLIVLDESPFISARAAGMGGALSTLADGIHAPYYNPAGIGGIHWERDRPPYVRQVHFPYVGVSANENSSKLISSDKKIASDAIGEAIKDDRQYVRASVLTSVVLQRFMLTSYFDRQVAAVKKSAVETEEANEEIAFAFQDRAGVGAGFSFVDERERFHLGLFSSYSQREFFKGAFETSAVQFEKDRDQIVTDHVSAYSGLSSNIGMLWIMGKAARPSLALVVKDVGGSKYEVTKKAKEFGDSEESLEKKEDITLGFSISPKVGRAGSFNLLMEGQNLSNTSIAVNKKFRLAAEFNLGAFGSEAPFSLRTGYNLAGISYGFSFNLGLIQLEFASEAHDIGLGNKHELERRNHIVFSTNVIDQ